MSANLRMNACSDEGTAVRQSLATRQHRSSEGDARGTAGGVLPAAARLTPAQVLARVRRLRLRTPSESAKMIRADRNAP